MTTATGSFALNFAALSDTNPYTNASLTEIGTGRGKILSGVYRWASGAASRTAQIYNGSVSGNLAAKIEFNTAAGSGDAIAAIICDTSGNGYAAVCNSATSLSLIRISALNQADVLGSGNPAAASGDVVELRLNPTTHLLEVYKNGSTLSISATDSTVTANLKPGFMAVADNTGNATIKSFALDGSAAAGPTITNITTLNEGATATITGTGFPTSQTGSAALVIGGQSQTVTWSTSTTATFTVAPGTNKFNVSVNAVLTDAAGNASANFATTFQPAVGWSFINAVTPFSAATRIHTTPTDIANGDQIAYTSADGEVVYSDLSYALQSGDSTMQFKVNDGTAWGSVGTVTLTAPAVASNALFKPQFAAMLNNLMEVL